MPAEIKASESLEVRNGRAKSRTLPNRCYVLPTVPQPFDGSTCLQPCRNDSLPRRRSRTSDVVERGLLHGEALAVDFADPDCLYRRSQIASSPVLRRQRLAAGFPAG